MRFKTNRKNLQVYKPGSTEPIESDGFYLESDDDKIIKLLLSIEGVKEVPYDTTQPQKEAGFFSKKKGQEIMRNFENGGDNGETA